MRHWIYIFVIIITIMPSTHALLWENFETHTLFSTSQWQRIVNFESYNISAGMDMWASWNSTYAMIYRGDKLVKNIHLLNAENLWVGGGFILVKYKNSTLAIINLQNTQKEYLKMIVNKAILTSFGAVIFSNSIYLLNLKNYSLKNLLDYRFGCIDFYRSSFIFYKENQLLGVRRDFSTWSIDFKEKIKGVNVSAGYYYVLCEKYLYVLNDKYKILDQMQTDAQNIVTSVDFGTLIEEMVDDEGKRQWMITVVSMQKGDLNVIGHHVTYLKPLGFSSVGRFIAFYDSRFLHLLNKSTHMCSNNTLKSIEFTNDTIIGYNDTGIYILTYENILKNLKNLGPDTDLDWIPNSKDPDDDNDGMPDWWEKKYGLNPLDASDRNTDLDGDGLTNYQEYLYGTDPRNPDTDGDGLTDGYEVAHGLNPLVPNPSVKINDLLVESIILIFMFIIAIIGEIRIKMEKE